MIQHKPCTTLTEILLRLLCTLLLCILCTDANADVQQMLDTFNKKQTAENANLFFKELQHEGFIDEPVNCSKETKQRTQGLVWYWAAEWYYDRQQYEQADDIARKALPLLKGEPEEADCLNILSIINIRLANFEEAAKFAKQCYALDEATGDPGTMSSSLNTLCAIYLAAGQPKEATKYIVKAIEMAEKVDNPYRMATLQGVASEAYHALGDDQTALKHIERALAIDQQTGDTTRTAIHLADKASVLIGLHNYGDAEQLLVKAIPVLRNINNRQSFGIACNKMGMALMMQQRPDEAIPYYREAANTFQQLGDIYNEVHARKGLYEVLWKKNPDEAKRELDRFNDLKDSIYSTESAEMLARYNAEFGNDWLQLENHSQRTQKWQAVCLCIVISVIAIGIWWIMRRRNRQQAAINEKLSTDIRQLNEQYRQLNIHYDNALQSKSHDNSRELTAADREFVERTVNIINQLICDGSPDANSVAEKMGMSLFQFRQRLTKLTDETPQTFIQMVRMRRARHLLDNHPELNITEIASLCAYNDTPNFTRAFKKTFGLTPTQYLEKLNK